MANNELAWEQATLRFDAGWRPKNLLGDNTKLIKAEKFGLRGLGLSLAPASVSGFEVCASRSPECTRHCIFTSGRGVFQTTAMGRIFRTIWMFKDRPSFMNKLALEINRNRDAAIRLNVFSDWMWERQAFELDHATARKIGVSAGHYRNLMDLFPNVQFYDYTKHFKRMFREIPPNYHLTFSLHEANVDQAQAVLRAGHNVAAVTEVLSGSLFGFPVISGEDHDLRFMDPSPVIVGLKPKGSLRYAKGGEFVYATDQFNMPAAA